MKVRNGKTGLVLVADPDVPDERAVLDEFVKLGSPSKELVLGAVTHKSDMPEGPTEIAIEWQAKA